MTASARKRLYLIDGYSNIFRAFYAIRNLSNSKGLPTNAVYGFVQMLRKLLRDEEPEYIGIAYDVSSDTFRKEEFAEYKANRKPMPDDLSAQMPYIRRVIDALRIPIYEQRGFEADDVLGTLARKAVAEGFHVVLVSTDKDLMQLVSEHVSLLHAFREKTYDPEGVAEDFGVPPTQVVDVLALMGDTSDNVPGVPGIGAKGAKTLISEYGDMETLLDSAADLKRKSYREGLQEHREQALLSKRLVTIDCDLELDFDASRFVLEAPDQETLFELYRELEFVSLVEEMEASGIVQSGVELAPARLVSSVSAWQELVDGWAEQGKSTLALAHVRAPGEPLLGLAFAAFEAAAVAEEAEAVYVDFRQETVRDACLEWTQDALAGETWRVIGHDLKETLLAIGAQRVRVELMDTMLASYLLPSATRGYSLTEVAMDRLHHRVMKAEEAGFKKGEAPLPDHPPLLQWTAETALLPVALWAKLAVQLEHDEVGRAREVYETIEAPLLPVLLRMEQRGVALDCDFLAQMSTELGEELDGYEAEIYELAGEEFNINSPKQLGEILFEKMALPVVKRTRKTKSYSTNAEALEELASRGFDLPARILSYRELAKLRSTYVDALPQLVADDGRLHTSYQQAVAATGRLSSTNPNVQNIPVRSERGQLIRKAFVAEQGHELLVADYSQIELRVLAHIAEEETLIEIFDRGGDVHQSTAAKVFGVAEELVGADQRRAAKTINFGIIYGMSAFGLAQRLGIARKEAAQFIDAYFEQFPGVKRYTEETIEEAVECGWVETLYGRRRYLPDLRSRNRNLKENAKRMAINARIQGTAADLLKLAMIEVDDRLAREWRAEHESGEGAPRLLLTVHDELMVETPDEVAEQAAATLQEEMQGVAELRVPLVVEVGRGRTWYDAKG